MKNNIQIKFETKEHLYELNFNNTNYGLFTHLPEGFILYIVKRDKRPDSWGLIVRDLNEILSILNIEIKTFNKLLKNNGKIFKCKSKKDEIINWNKGKSVVLFENEIGINNFLQKLEPYIIMNKLDSNYN